MNKMQRTFNKYDNAEINHIFGQEFESFIKQENGEPLITKNLIKWVFKVLIAFSILYSYFHAPSFPFDKPIIFMYSMLYLLLELVYKIYDRFIVKEFSQFYNINLDKQNCLLQYKSDIKDFSNEFIMTLKLNKKTK